MGKQRRSILLGISQVQTKATTRYCFSHPSASKNFKVPQYWECQEWRETQALVYSVQTQVSTDVKEHLVVSCKAGDTRAPSPSSSVSRCVPKCFQQRCGIFLPHTSFPTLWYAAAAKSLQLCLTLCDPIEGRPPGSPIPGILQARTLEWIAISFSNAWKGKGKVKSLSRVQLLPTPWTEIHQAPPSMGFSRQECRSGVPLD